MSLTEKNFTFLSYVVDVQAPKFAKESECSEGIVIRKPTLEGESYAIINFEEIQATDNSGEAPEVTCITEAGQACEYKMGENHKFGIVNGKRIMFKAMDRAGNHKLCRFQVFVEGINFSSYPAGTRR